MGHLSHRSDAGTPPAGKGAAPHGWEEGAPLDPGRKRRVMAACGCILGNETAERLAYCEQCRGWQAVDRSLAPGVRCMRRSPAGMQAPTPGPHLSTADTARTPNSPNQPITPICTHPDGIQTNMSLYAKQYLGYGAARATALLQAWKASVYLTPLLGAFLADAYFGRQGARCCAGWRPRGLDGASRRRPLSVGPEGSARR